jgi:hypothetical protein
MVWHFPIDDTEHEWLCVRIPVAPKPSNPPWSVLKWPLNQATAKHLLFRPKRSFQGLSQVQNGQQRCTHSTSFLWAFSVALSDDRASLESIVVGEERLSLLKRNKL